MRQLHRILAFPYKADVFLKWIPVLKKIQDK